MTNFEEIKAMDAKELAGFLANADDCWDLCVYGGKCLASGKRLECCDGIKLWLESEVRNA